MDKPVKLASSLAWELTEVKGNVSTGYREDDVVTCFKFNRAGTKFVSADRGGRCIVFERLDDGLYDYICLIHSHEDYFDSLRSSTVSKEINAVEWLPSGSSSSDMLLCTNDRTIKLWKIGKRPPKQFESFNNKAQPLFDDEDSFSISSSQKHEYSGHSFHINSISMNSDQQLFLSSDELRINIWDVNRTDIGFLCLDIKPEDLSDCTEIIQTTKFHPSSCNLFAFGMNTGIVRLCDMRQTAHCESQASVFSDDSDNTSKLAKKFTSDLYLTGVTSIEFSSDGNHMFARDYMTVKVYDLRSNHNTPMEVHEVSDHITFDLSTIANSAIHSDIFSLSLSPDDRYIVAGSHSTFTMIDRHEKTKCIYDINKANSLSRTSSVFAPKKIINCDTKICRPKISDTVLFRNVDIHKKLSTIWNPKHNEIVVSCTKLLYTFQGKNKPLKH